MAIVLWTASLLLPAMRINDQISSGWSFAAIGIVGLMFGYVEWLANPLLLGCAIVSWGGLSLVSRIGWCAALTLLLVIATMRTGYAVNEGGAVYPVQQHLIGYYLWLASIGVMASASLFRAPEQL